MSQQLLQVPPYYETNLAIKTNNMGLHCYSALAALMLIGATFAIVRSNSKDPKGLGMAGTVVLIILSLLELAKVALFIDLFSRIFGLSWKIFPDRPNS